MAVAGGTKRACRIHRVVACHTRPMARRPVSVALLACSLVVAGCGSSNATTPSTPTVPADTTTGTAVATSTSTSTTSIATTTTSASTTLPSSTTAAEITTTAEAITTAAPPVAQPALYGPAPAPATPTQTDPIDPAWVQPDGTLAGVADGSYWGVATGVGDAPQKYVGLRLVQAFFGDACRAKFGDGDDVCRNDYGTLESPTGTLQLFVGTAAVTVSDPSTQASYAIDVAELHRLLGAPPGAATPGPGAPAGYLFVPFAFLVRIAGGQIVSAEQVWTP